MLATPLLEELARRSQPAPEDLESSLDAIVRAARAAWPTVHLDGALLIAYLAQRWPDNASLDEWLSAAHINDLYLTCACAHAIDGAIETFDRAHLGAVRDYLANTRPDDAFVDDVRQSLREKLFVGERRKIEAYSGRGALGGWVRMLSVRAAIDLRRQRGERPFNLRQEEPSTITPELRYLSQRYSREVESAFSQAVTRLDGEQRTLLRMHFVDAVTLDELARLKNLNRRTIARHLASARETLLEETCRHLRTRLSVSSDELASLFRLVRSELQISVARLFAP
jgi:RNA polymerase sigma-70 factor (ECF subfamily)